MNITKKGKASRRAAAKAFQSNNLISLGGKQKSFDVFDYAEGATKTQVNSVCDDVCDECALPLKLYGSNYIESYTNGRANILRCLCDLHADEWEVGK